MKIFVALFLAIPLFINAQEIDASDILFLKIQELEGELANLRSELESQGYLLEKLLSDELTKNENQTQEKNLITSDVETFRFEGINDSNSIDEVYDQAIAHLNEKDFKSAKGSFNYLADNFDDQEKIPLSLFWLGEISLLESNLEESDQFFQRLAANYPDHWRTPLAHKKIGDILRMSGELGAAKSKYQYVIQSYPENTASSLALQLLENME
jgi:TolA-binding protein